MSYIALYRKWRPKAFSEVVEQKHVVQSLQNTVKSKRIAHAYLFCGTRGTGKTTMAKIFSRAINCLAPVDGNPCNTCEICTGILKDSFLDVIEIDAASNNGVDNIRDLRDSANYSPAKAAYKVYIIDEVHMLSTGAFNALLKTLEEPPPNIVFILATTDPQKLPATILSRCQRFDFKRISEESIASRLTYIADNSGCTLEDSASFLLARLADGALRDGVSMLDQCIAIGDGNVTSDIVKQVTGLSGSDMMIQLTKYIIDHDASGILDIINEISVYGRDIQRFTSEYISYCRDLLICSVSSAPEKLIDPSHPVGKVMEQAHSLGTGRIGNMIKDLSRLEGSLKFTGQPRILLESALLQLSLLLPSGQADLEERLGLLEQKISEGHFTNQRSDTPRAIREDKNIETEQDTSKEIIKTEIGKKPKKRSAPGKFDRWDDVLKDLLAFNYAGLHAFLKDSDAYRSENEMYYIVPKDESFCVHISRKDYTAAIQSSIERVVGGTPKIKILLCASDLPDEMPKKNKETVPKKAERETLEDKLQELARMADVPFDIEEER